MPSPFPGMDPYIESQEWSDFHASFVPAIREALMPRLRPKYEARVERRVYVEHVEDVPPRIIVPDATVLEQEEWHPDDRGGTAVAAVASIAPVLCAVPLREERREAFLTVREIETRKVVTVLECLSPDNKRRGSRGRRKYLRKREQVLHSPAHLVELDLLRGGERLPMLDPLPAADYYALVCRGRRLKAEVYAWRLRDRLPVIPIPLAGDDPDVPLNLQEVFSLVYDRAGYDYTLRYDQPLDPALDEPAASWAREVVQVLQTRR